MIFIPLTSNLVTDYFRGYPGSTVTLRSYDSLTTQLRAYSPRSHSDWLRILRTFFWAPLSPPSLLPCMFSVHHVAQSLALTCTQAYELLSLYDLVSLGILSFFSIWLGVSVHIGSSWVNSPCQSDKMTGFMHRGPQFWCLSEITSSHHQLGQCSGASIPVSLYSCAWQFVSLCSSAHSFIKQ